MASAKSSAQPAQEDQLVTGDWLSSGYSKYQVQSFLGQGSFGKVAKCTRMDDMKTVAIKMMKDEGRYVKQAIAEVNALMKLKPLDPDKSNLVKWFHVFTDKGHNCLEFEHLDKSLFDFMQERYFRPLHLKEIRPIVQQLANALNHLKSVRMIHADLKLENVMLVNHAQEPYRVKLIDFGLACSVSAARPGSYTQTRHYRSPEIILGLSFTEAIDMWSLGCIAASLYLGTLLYPGSCEYDMIRYIVETQGQPPDNLLSSGHKTRRFFQKDYNSTTSQWKLKTPAQYQLDTGILPKETRRLKLSSLDAILHIRDTNPPNSADKVAEKTDLLMFVDLLKGMLHLDATKRLTPRQVMEHPFISMCNMVSMYPLSSHVRTCFDIMNVCQETLTSDSGKAVCESLQQPSSSTAQPVQHNCPPPPAERSSPSQQNCISPRPCTSTQTTSSVKSGIKRKVDNEEGNIHETFHLSKRVKSGWYRYANRRQHACPSTSSSSKDTTDYTQTSSTARSQYKRKMADGDDVDTQQRNSDHYDRSHEDRKRFRRSHASPSTSSSSKDTADYTQTSSVARSQYKRRMADGDDVEPRQRNSDHYDRSHEDRKRFQRSHASPSTSSSGKDTTDYTKTSTVARSQYKRRMADGDDVEPQQRNSDHYDRSHEDRKRFQRSHACPSTSSSGKDPTDYNQTSTIARSQYKRRMADGDDVEPRQRNSDHYDRSSEDRKRFRRSHASPSTSSSSKDTTDYTQASTVARSQDKRRMADGDDVEPRQKNSDHYDRSHEDRKRFQRSHASPSTSSCSSWHQSYDPPRVKRTHDEDFDSDYRRSDHERVRKRYTGRATYSSSDRYTSSLHFQPDWTRGPAEHHHHSSTQAENRDRPGLKRVAADKDDVQQRKSTPAIRSGNDSQRHLVSSEVKRRELHQREEDKQTVPILENP